ncbi:MAG: nagA [Dactylosporangium sp.]|nr:nagA [Dactylosporangium sp.]
MSGLLLTNARVVSRAGVINSGWLASSGTTIDSCGRGAPAPDLYAGRRVLDARGATVLPGFVDVHVHGAVGHEVMDASVEGLAAMSDFFVRHGVTSFLATTWTADTEQTMSALKAVSDASSGPMPGAQLLGAHMEGPYISLQKCGAQDPAAIRPPDLVEARRFLDTGTVRMITLAPELAGANSLLDECVDRGVRVSIGHTDATFEQVVDAVNRGARHLTHTFNAMPPLHHRRPGPIAAAMTMPELLSELIADNVHVHPAVVAAMLRAKGPEGVVLVTDALRPTGLPHGSFTIGGRPISVTDGAVRLSDGTLAGSVLTMDQALRNLVRATGRPVVELWPTASRNGALAAGVADTKGDIAAGMDADLVVVDDDVRVKLTVVQGRVAYTSADFTTSEFQR